MLGSPESQKRTPPGALKRAHLPEHPQEPVIDAAKDAGHGGWSGYLGEEEAEENKNQEEQGDGELRDDR